MNDSPIIPLLLLVLFFVGFLLGILAGNHEGEKTMQREAVLRGVAMHDPITGKWKWTVEKKPELEKKP